MCIKIKKSEFKKIYDIACPEWQRKFIEKFEGSVFLDELEFEESFLDEMEKDCDSKQLKIFKQIFPSYVKEDLFSIKTYSEVCKKLNIEELTEKDFKQFEFPKQMLAFHKLKNIEKLFNGDWIKDWSNTNQYKYYPYFTINGSGAFGFGVSSYGCCSYYDGCVAFFKDKKTSDFIGKTFIDLYKDLS